MASHAILTRAFLVAFLSFPAIANASDWETLRSQMQDSVGLYGKIASNLGNLPLADRARRVQEEWDDVSGYQLKTIFADSAGFDFDRIRIEIALDIDRLEVLVERLERAKTAAKPPNPFAALTSSSCGEIEEAECELGISGVTQEDLAIAITATNTAAIAAVTQKAACKQITIAPIETVDPFVMDPLNCTCVDIPDFICTVACLGFSAGGGVTQEGGEGGSSTSAHHSASIGTLCNTVKNTALVAAQSQQTIATQLACWKAGRAEAIYEGMEVLQCVVEELRDLIVDSETILIGDSLHRKGGSRPAILYLEDGEGGNLTKVRAVLQAAIENTEAADYVVSERARKFQEKGDLFRSFGDVKKAFDHYRRSYQQTTISSRGRGGG